MTVMEKRLLKYLGILGTCILLLFASRYFAAGKGGNYNYSPHADSTYGVLRDSGFPRGDCSQCHTQHDGASPFDFCLFADNTNSLCYTGSSCHSSMPSGYPAQETDRMPEGSTYPGYFEYNSGGTKINGVDNRKRWPGQVVFENSSTWTTGKYYSPHRNDEDMTYQDASGYGLCKNCHNPHGTANHFDMLDTTYLNIQGFQLSGRPPNYQLCFDCHSSAGPANMDQENKYIGDYYDQSVNDDQESGHQIKTTQGYVTAGDKLPCYDCHNPHGSRGNDGVQPNAYLLSDQRTGWSGLDSIKTSNYQVRKFCFGCHKSSDNLGGGEVEGITMSTLPSAQVHTYSDSTHCYDCHGGSYSSPTSRNVHHPNPGGDCVSCHQYAQDGGDGAPTRRVITGSGGEFAKNSHHVSDGIAGEDVANEDCGVCHMEGSPSTGQMNATYHQNNLVNLRDPDTGDSLTSFSVFSRDTSTNVLESWVTNVQNNLCLKCHDSNGASSPNAQTPGATAQQPFTSNTRNAPNIYDLLNPANSFHHAVRAAGNNLYCTSTDTNGNVVTMEPPWNQTANSHDLISCFDCHIANAHGADSTGMLREETHYKDATVHVDFDIGMKNLCIRCHKASVYVAGGAGSRLGTNHGRSSHQAEDDGGKSEYGCRGCHAGVYDDDRNTGCDNGSGIAVIHGGDFTWPSCSETPASQSLRFILGGYISGWEQDSTVSHCYGGSCHHRNGVDY